MIAALWRGNGKDVENEALVHDLLAWIGTASRPYDEVIGAWRSTCPRLSIWEDALDAGLVEVDDERVRVTTAGREFLIRKREAVGAN